MTQFQNAFIGETHHANQDPVDEFSSFNPESTREYKIELPGEGRQTIESEKPLIVAMARANRFEPNCGAGDAKQSVDAIFDEALCEVAEKALQAAGIEASPVGLQKLRALMIGVTRELSVTKLQNHVSQYSAEELERFGLNKAYSRSTYGKAKRRLENTGLFSQVVDASYIAVHVLFGAGVPLPDTVKNTYELSYAAGPAASDFSFEVRDLLLYELVTDLLEIVVERLDFGRGENASRELRSLPGAFAHAAGTGDSIEDYKQTAHHTFDVEDALSGSTIRRCIDKLDRWDIRRMFDAINRSLLAYVLESGVIADPVRVAYDLVNIDCLGSEPFDGVFTTSDGRWRFASLSFVGAEFEFAFGLRLLKSESQRSAELKNLLRALTSMVDVELFFADRGFDGVRDFEACRTFVPNRWAIHAQDNSGTTTLDADYAKLKTKLEPGRTAVISDAGFERLEPPVQLLGHSGAARDSGSLDPFRAFWSGIPLPEGTKERDRRIRELNSQYDQRGKIETQFRLSKNRFDVSTDSRDPNRKLFYYNMSTLFYNLYKIANTVPSPKRGAELDVKQTELLQAIQVISFGGVTRSKAYQHLQNNS